MGLFWDLLQQSQISDQSKRAGDLESRVRRLESELSTTRQHLHTLITILENKFDEDLNRDGRIG